MYYRGGSDENSDITNSDDKEELEKQKTATDAQPQMLSDDIVPLAATLQDQINSAADGAAITLNADYTEDITISKNLTLDLNGHTIQGVNMSMAKSVSSVTAAGSIEVTIQDTSKAQTGTINGGGYNYTLQNGGCLAITGGAKVTLSGGTLTEGFAYSGGGVYVGGDSTFVLDGGTITWCQGMQNGAGIYVDTKGKATIKSGIISSNTSWGLGGGIYINSDSGNTNGGSVDIANALISDNTASDGGQAIDGDSSGWNITKIYASHGAVITNNGSSMNKDIVNRNTTTNSFLSDYAMDGTPYNWKSGTGSAKYATNTEKIAAAAAALRAAGELQVFIQENNATGGGGGAIFNMGNLTIGQNSSQVTFLKKDGSIDTTMNIYNEGSAIPAYTPAAIAGHKFDGWELEAGSLHKLAPDDKVVVDVALTPKWILPTEIAQIDSGQKFVLIQEAVDAANAGGDTITILDDYSGRAVISGKKNLVIDLNGHTVKNTGGTPFIISNGSTVTFTDSSQNAAGKFLDCAVSTGADVTDPVTQETIPLGYGGGLIITDSGTTVTWEKGIIENGSAFRGGAVYVEKGASFTMTGGTFKNCSVMNDPANGNFGGAIYTEGGDTALTIEGGTIEGCSADKGGGIYTSYTRFVMTGGLIKHCVSKHGGGGIHLAGETDFSMQGGTIEENYAEMTGGGGLMVDCYAQAIIKAGTFHRNATGGIGGAIYVEGDNDKQGELTICKALIASPGVAVGEAEYPTPEGAYGVYTCQVGSTRIYADQGAVIYSNGNAGSKKLRDLYFQPKLFPDTEINPGRGEHFVSDYALDGSPYCWSDPKTDIDFTKAPRPYQTASDHTELRMYHKASDPTEDLIIKAAQNHALFSVFILDNQTVYQKSSQLIPYDGRGGAIANNGNLTIGQKPASAVLTLKGRKTFTNAVLQGGDFSFALYEADAAFTVKGAALQTVKNDASGEFAFADLNFDEMGVYYYVVKEVAGGESSIEYDTTEYGITITVTEAEKGHKAEAKESIVKLGDNSMVSSITFANVKKKTPDEPTRPTNPTDPAEPADPNPNDPKEPADPKPNNSTEAASLKLNSPTEAINPKPGEPLREDQFIDSPQTGDNSNMMFWIVLLLISGLGAAITIVVNRKRRDRK